MAKQNNVKREIDFQYLQSILDYNPNTGSFVWKERCSPPSFNSKFAGKRAGNRKGGKYGNYWAICVDGTKYVAHRLAWAYVYGEWPDLDIDHIDGNGMNNTISNLRIATRSQNLMNAAKRTNNVSGIRGVSWHKQCKKWCAQIRHNKKAIHLGLFETKEAAIMARKIKEQELFGEFARVA